MRLLGNRLQDVDTTTTVNMLTRAMMTKPEILSSTLNLFERHKSTFGSFLNRQNLTSHDLYAGAAAKENFRVVGNRKVQWRLKGYSKRKGAIISHDGGSTPGLANADFNIVVSTNWFSKNDNLELVDRSTLLHVKDKQQTSQNTTTYRVALVTNSSTTFCDPTLLTAGKEIGWGHTMFPELSEDGSEKNTYGEWHTEFLGIQRMKHTISGSANATKVAIEHNGVMMWDYQQNIDMLERWAEAMEHQLLFGKATIDANDRVYVQDLDGRDLIAGNGILAQGDPALRMQYNTLSIRMLERIMENLQLMANGSGVTEVAVCCGQSFYGAFQRLMRDVMQQNPIVLYEEGANGSKIKTNFNRYQFQDITLNVMRCPAFDDLSRPIERDQYGNSNMSDRAFFVSLGDTVGNNGKNVELITLGNGGEDRSFVQRVINGMTGDGPMVQAGEGSNKAMMLASSPVDGKQVHILSETGVVVRNPLSIAQLVKARRR